MVRAVLSGCDRQKVTRYGVYVDYRHIARVISLLPLAWRIRSAPRRMVVTGELPYGLIDMCSTCNHVKHMSKMIQIRNVPDAVHRRLKARAASEGLSLSEYLLREVTRVAEAPSDDELWTRLRSRRAIEPTTPISRMVRETRDER